MTKVLQGKTALVTGASRGIGRSIAQRLAASGALVAINYAANESAARETLKLIETQGGEGFIINAVLGTPEAAKKLAAELDAELSKRTGNSGLDILVNNAGGSGDTYATIETTTPEIYGKTFANNVGSAFFTTQAVLPLLKEGGRVINISSAGARLAVENLIVYSMSKAAVNVFTIALAKHLGPRGITVNAVAPGFVATETITRAINNPDAVKQIQANTVLGRPYAQPEEISEVVHHLATPAMGWITGQIIEASGGFRL